MEPPFQAYQGEEPYIFICYAHADKAVVYPEILWLHEQGVHVWYDEGISAGSNWRETVGTSLLGSFQVVSFISESSIQSLHCNREINLALDEDKAIVPVYLEKTELTPDLKMGLSRIHALDIRSARYRQQLLGVLKPSSRAIDQNVSAANPIAPFYRSRLLLLSIMVITVLTAIFFAINLINKNKKEVAIEARLEEIRLQIETGDQYGAFENLMSLNLKEPVEVPELLDSFFKISLDSNPTNVQVWIKHMRQGGEWINIGRTPLVDVPVPSAPSGLSPYLWRFSKPGFLTRELQVDTRLLGGYGLRRKSSPIAIKLLPESDLPEMEPVRTRSLENYMSNYAIGLPDNFIVPEFLIDRYEVTCADYKVFVDSGGYQKDEYWEELDFVVDGKSISFEEAREYFVDSTGRPGPANWEFGNYPSGKANHPVTGISWYEAMAYAKFAGKSLPSIYHWVSAVLPLSAQMQVPYSNFGSNGTMPVGSSVAGTSGQRDSFGNAREWLLNETGTGYRWIQGGSWDDPPYIAISPYALPPIDRNIRNGMRLAKFDQQPLFTEKVEQVYSNKYRKNPVGEEAFNIIKEQYQQIETPLRDKIESTEKRSEFRLERVSLDSDIPGERFNIHLFLPPDKTGPFQPILYFPNTVPFMATGGFKYPLDIDFMPRAGRAVIYPVYWGAHERYRGLYDRKRNERGGQVQLDLRKHWYADVKRTIDYLETREDLDHQKIGYYGTSLGASHALAVLALEKRIKAGVISAGGLGNLGFNPMPAAADPVNFLSELKIPLLILNGSYDFIFPVESQKIMVKLIGTPDAHKSYVVFPFGHNEYPRPEFRKLVVDWYDKYLGVIE